MNQIARNLALACLVAASGIVARRSLGVPPTAPERRDWITQYVEDDVSNGLSQLYVVTSGDGSKFGDDLRLELRTADLSHRIAQMTSPIGLGTGFGLTDEQRRNIGALPDGAYLLAWTTDKRRCSNVLKFILDSHHKAADEPVLRLTQLEPARPGGMGELLVTACRRVAADAAPTQCDLAFPTVIVDGKTFEPKVIMWIGPDGPLDVGGTSSRTIALDNYDLKIDTSKPHRIAVRVGTNQTVAQPLVTDTPLADAWDRATAKIIDAPAQPVSLRGSVVGVGSMPAVNYEIDLRGPGTFETASAKDGTFMFANIPSGKYELYCNPPAEGSPQFHIEALYLPRPPEKPLVLSFETKFAISGTVMTAAGVAAGGCDVDSTWRSPAGDIEYDCRARTDGNGHYQIDSPFAVATYVGISGTGKQPDPYHDVQAPRGGLDFRLKTGAR